ncbi:hypothetical protein, partial [Bacteroides fragilis]|uniref:hypothetical protein n=1 Tax=Bacteroides fragilis TaxID=817 RepID=UPI000516CB1B
RGGKRPPPDPPHGGGGGGPLSGLIPSGGNWKGARRAPSANWLALRVGSGTFSKWSERAASAARDISEERMLT